MYGRQPLRVKLSNKERTAYPNFFAQADPKNTGRIEGKAAVEFFRRSNLPVDMLKEIWTLSTPSGEAFLDRERFYVSLRLIALAQQRKPANAQSITANVEVDLPQFFDERAESFDITAEEKAKLEKVFESNFPGKVAINGPDARALFNRAGIEHSDLVKIWNLSDPQDTGVLNKNQFVVAMQLILKAKQRVKVPDALPAPLQAIVSAASAPPPSPAAAPQEPAKEAAEFVPAPVRAPSNPPPAPVPIAAPQPQVDPAAITALTNLSQDLLRSVKALEARLEDVSTELKSTKSELKSIKGVTTQHHTDTLTVVDEILKAQKRSADEEKEAREAVMRVVREEVANLRGEVGPRSESGADLAEIKQELNDLQQVRLDVNGLREELAMLGEFRQQMKDVETHVTAVRRELTELADVKGLLETLDSRLADLESAQHDNKSQGESILRQLETLGEELSNLSCSPPALPAVPTVEPQAEAANTQKEDANRKPQFVQETEKPKGYARMNDPFAISEREENLMGQDPFGFDAMGPPPGSGSPKEKSTPTYEGGPPALDFDFGAGQSESPADKDFGFLMGQGKSGMSPKQGREADPFLSPDEPEFDFAGSHQSGKGFEFEDKGEDAGKDAFNFEEKKADINFDF